MYVDAHMPFGDACAPEDFSMLMSTFHRPFRQAGHVLSVCLDDALFAAATEQHYCFIIKTVVLLLTPLGFCIS